MTDEKLDELEAACSAAADGDGKVELYPDDVLEIVNELRELRKHATALSALEGAVGTMHRLLTNLCAYGERPPDVGVMVSSPIAVQDPGR
jgi:hypothetical protein